MTITHRYRQRRLSRLLRLLDVADRTSPISETGRSPERAPGRSRPPHRGRRLLRLFDVEAPCRR